MLGHDLVLSSGFLAFGAQAGFLAGVEEAGLPVDGLCGTSSGALAGALWAAGLPAARVLEVLGEQTPLHRLALSRTPWRGVFSMDAVVAHLRGWLPTRIEDLPRPFGVGVASQGGHVLLRSGPLPEAVAASCAMPWLFTPLVIAGRPCSDGGAVDRTGLSAWRAWRGPRPTVLHLVDRSHGAEDAAVPADVLLVRSPRSGARLWDLGPIRERYELARRATLARLSATDIRHGGTP
jgi:predicted acylesterase/phospholipase RssA